MDRKQSFQYYLMQAKLCFEAALRQPPGEQAAFNASLDAMLYNCARARRMARDDPTILANLGLDQKEFVGFMDDVAATRNVQEHWQDVINPRKPKVHSHTTKNHLKIAVDETSLIVLGPDEIYKGKLNLHDVYQYVIAKLSQIQPPRRS